MSETNETRPDEKAPTPPSQQGTPQPVDQQAQEDAGKERERSEGYD